MPDIARLRQSIKAKDGWWASIFSGPLANRLLEPIADIQAITPNHITIFSLFIGLVAAYFFAQGNHTSLIIGAVLVQLSFVIDCMDGQLARYRQQFSNLGAWLDRISDRVKDFVYFFALAWGFFHQNSNVFYIDISGIGNLLANILGQEVFLLPADFQVVLMQSIAVPSWFIWPLAMFASFTIFLIDYYVNQDMKLAVIARHEVSKQSSQETQPGLLRRLSLLAMTILRQVLQFGIKVYNAIPILRFNIGEQALLITIFTACNAVFFLNCFFALLGGFYCIYWPITKLQGISPSKN